MLNRTHYQTKYFSLSEAITKFISSVLIVANRAINDEIVNSGNMNFALVNGADRIALALDDSFSYYFAVFLQ